jgi:hypothetical protein
MSSGSAEPPADTAGGLRVYADYASEQPALQEQRKVSLEARAVTVITTAGALATVLLALAAFAKGDDKTLAIGGSAAIAIRVALVAFLVAAVLALLVNAPLNYERSEEQKLRDAIRGAADDDAAYALAAVAHNQLDIAAASGGRNQTKAWLLLGAMAFEVVAVGAIAFAVWKVI